MAQLRFEWDEHKNAENRRRHRVSVEEAMTVFSDDNALLIGDPDHSDDEDRFMLLGLSVAIRVLVVVHCCREADDTTRIISARKANKLEYSQYFGR